jgi:hypothetical protein
MDFIEVVPRLRMLRFPIGQAYLRQYGDGSLTLVDSGPVGSAPAIEAAVRGAGPIRPGWTGSS